MDSLIHLAIDMTTRIFVIVALWFLTLNTQAQGFIPNQGQWTESFAFKKGVPGGNAYLENDGILFHLTDRSGLHGVHYEKDASLADNIAHHHVFKLRFLGANLETKKSTSRPYPHYLNYYLGDESRWRTKIHPTEAVTYEGIYDDIDLTITESGRSMKYEFVVNPGGDYREIRMKVDYADEVKLTRDGNVLIKTSVSDILDTKPKVYQSRGKKTWEIDAAFVLSGTAVSYSIGAYDTTLPLIIDPELIFSTFSGSESDNWGYTATPGLNGVLYAGSASTEDGYPTTTGAFDVDHNGGPNVGVPSDVTISKFTSDGNNLVYSTYLGGGDTDSPHSLIVDDDDHLFLLGTTGSDDFPTTNGAADRSFGGGQAMSAQNLSFGIPYPNGSDMFVTKFNASGTSLLGSTYLGGSGNDGINNSQNIRYNYGDEARGEIMLDENNEVIIASCTRSDDFPRRGTGYQTSLAGQLDGVVSKLNSDLTEILWSTYLGGTRDDGCYGVAVSESNELFICGGTQSLNFPTTISAFQTGFGGGQADGFIAHLNEDGDDLISSTYFGSNVYDQMYLIQLDNQGYPHVFGQTENTGNHFIFNAGFNDVGGGQVLARFRPNLESRVWSTQFGSTSGRPNISPTSFLVDVCNSVYIAGWGGRATQNFNNNNNNASDVGGLPVTNGAFKSTPDPAESEFYLAIFDSDANTQTYGSFFGGDQSGTASGEHVDGGTSRFDRGGVIYQAVCAGCGGSNDFPIEPDPGAWSTTNESVNCNLGVFKIDMELPIIVADFDMPSFACAPITFTPNNQSLIQNATTFSWDLGNGQTSTAMEPSITLTQAGTYTIQLIASDPNSCNLNDTISREIVIKTDTAYVLDTLSACVGDAVQIGPPDARFKNLGDATLSWVPSQSLNNATSLNPVATPNQTTTYVLRIDYGGCVERITQTVEVDRFELDMPDDTIVCSTFNPFTIVANAINAQVSYEWSRDPNFSTIISTDSSVLIDGLTQARTQFFVRATKDNGCDIIDTFDVTVSDFDLLLTNDTSVCQDAGASIEAISTNPANTFHYFWTLEPYTGSEVLLEDTTSNTLAISNNEPTTYHLYARSTAVEGECIVRDSTRVQVSILSRAAVRATAEKDTFYFGEEIQLNGSPSDGFFHYWTPGRFLSDSTSGSPIAKPKTAMEYTYIVTDRDLPECSFQDTVVLTPYEIICGEPEVFLPTAFTPNGDGLNEVLFLRGRNVKDMELAIYDRWGKLMFETNDQSVGWDGTYNGVPVEPAVFVYYYEVFCIDDQRIFRKGNITITDQ